MYCTMSDHIMSAEGHSYVCTICISLYTCNHYGSQVPPSQQPQLHTSSERGGERPLTAPVVELRRRAGSVAAGTVLGCKGPSRMACPRVGAATYVGLTGYRPYRHA